MCCLSHSSFFRILLPGFSKRLLLPRKFAKHVEEEKRSKTVSLVNPNSESWHVNIYEDDQGMHIGGLGWLELVHAHNLRLGYFLIFRYEGHMVFSFRAFDLSTCEITYPSIAHWVAKKIMPKLVVIDLEEEIKRWPTSSNGNMKKGLMKSYVSGDAAVRLETRIRAINLSENYMNIPSRFKEWSGLWEQKELMTLRDPKGRLWTVVCKRAKGRRTPRCLMAKGWLDFARGNKLKKGDRCMFELVSRRKGEDNVLQVKILKQHK